MNIHLKKRVLNIHLEKRVLRHEYTSKETCIKT